jgi:hypothetical protein
MTILNKRNAILGWSVWQVGKMAAKRKAKQAMEPENTTRPSKRAAVAGLAALAGGAFLFWRRRSGNGEDAKP